MNRFRFQHILVVFFPILGALISGILQKEDPSHAGVTLMQIGIFIGIFMGIMTLMIRYLMSKYSYYVAAFIALIFAIPLYNALNAPISIFPLLLLNLIYGLLSVIMIRYLFYLKSLIRLRTLFLGIAGAICFGLYLYAIYAMISIPLPDDFWNPVLMYGLILYIFIGFAMSLADLLVLRIELNQLRKGDSSEDDQ